MLFKIFKRRQDEPVATHFKSPEKLPCVDFCPWDELDEHAITELRNQQHRGSLLEIAIIRDAQNERRQRCLGAVMIDGPQYYGCGLEHDNERPPNNGLETVESDS